MYRPRRWSLWLAEQRDGLHRWALLVVWDREARLCAAQRPSRNQRWYNTLSTLTYKTHGYSLIYAVVVCCVCVMQTFKPVFVFDLYSLHMLCNIFYQSVHYLPLKLVLYLNVHILYFLHKSNCNAPIPPGVKTSIIDFAAIGSWWHFILWDLF